MIKIFVARHPTEAHLVKGLLGTEGIVAEVQGEELYGARGAVPISEDTLPSVWVDEASAETALAIIESYANRNAATDTLDQPWRCPACGEQVESQFESCWKCGADRPS
jgi:hypothetical protein